MLLKYSKERDLPLSIGTYIPPHHGVNPFLVAFVNKAVTKSGVQFNCGTGNVFSLFKNLVTGSMRVSSFNDGEEFSIQLKVNVRLLRIGPAPAHDHIFHVFLLQLGRYVKRYIPARRSAHHQNVFRLDSCFKQRVNLVDHFINIH